MIIGILGNFKKPEAYEIFNELGKFLNDRNIRFYLLKNKDLISSNILYPKLIKECNYIAKNCDIIISIGGDGTIISSIRKFIKYNKPILGLHIGGLGFLAECNINNYRKRILVSSYNQGIIESSPNKRNKNKKRRRN